MPPPPFTEIRELLRCLILLAVLALLVVIVDATASLPGLIDRHMKSLESQALGLIEHRAEDLQKAALAEVDKQATAARERTDRQLSALQKNAFSEIRAVREMIDQRTGEALGKVDATLAIADARLGQVAGSISQVEMDIKPALANAAALEQDAKDSLDDLYFDLKAGLESGTVAARGVAEAAEAAGKAAPAIAQSAIDNGKNIAGITADVHTATSDFVKPKTTWQKIKSVLWLVAYGAAHAI